MKKIITGLLLFLSFSLCWGQNQEDNLKKYWKYRQRLRDKFMVVSGDVMDYGTNIPASDLSYDDNMIGWGDGNNNMSHYLTVLATELWILKHNNQDYSTTLKELYYAMLALERLDNFSESNFRWRNAYGSWVDSYRKTWYVYPGDLNGFSLRDDVSDEFWTNHGSHFDVGNFNSQLSKYNQQDYPMEENSQDVIEHTMEGLALVNKLVGTESVATIPCNFYEPYIITHLTEKGIMTYGEEFFSGPQTVNFSLWAQDIVKRYIRYMQYDGTYTLSGFMLPFGGSVSTITTHWILVNPVTNDYVQEGSGRGDMGVALISPGIIATGMDITGENLRVYPETVMTNQMFNDAFKDPTAVQNTTNFITDISGKPRKTYDDNLARSLACNGNTMGAETFSVLRNLRDTYDPFNTGHTPIMVNEHLPLMYLALHDPYYDVMGLQDAVYNVDKVLYEGLLNSAPCSGPATNCGVRDWTATSRCLWPQNLGKNSDKHTEFNGLDYMMLHNLYYIAFRKEDFYKSVIFDNGFYLDPRRLFSYRSGFIETSVSILGTNVNYTATRGIKLKNGFRATSAGGKSFKARIQPLPNNYQGGDYRVLSESEYECSPTVAKARRYNNLPDNTPISTLSNINDPTSNVNISLYPNPSTGFVSISVGQSDLPVSLDILNANSVVVYKGVIKSDKEQLDISSLPKGVYFVRLYLKDKTNTKKIILI